ncbi:cupin-like domain-containing protein [Legionella sp. km772]|uniref:cupin-like domain-containing protein n=1 Tax=Legionella sp. km772 TaxID=2498111 RepID=UPI000F8EC756|nr:cupin-like domain-containing protein [Legionella sp. km772]RUR04046.1 cupin [Legionella sp. km772]
MSNSVEYHVPLWRKLPQRPRFFNKFIRVVYFFGGQGSHTEMHYDREHCSILHLCLCGKKKFLLFTQDQSDNIYKTPFVGDTLIDFGLPQEELEKSFPRLKQAEGYEVVLEKGDMVFMPRNCWHFTSYIDASAAASYVLYPKKFFQFYGYVTGYFYMGLLDKHRGGVGLYSLPSFNKFRVAYALADGNKKLLYKVIEKVLYFFLLPSISLYTKVSFMLRPRRVY